MRRLVRSLCFVATVTVLILQSCGKSAPVSTERGNSAPAAGRATAADSVASAPEARPDWKTHERLGVANAARVQYRAEDDPPPWLADLLQAPDPNVRVQALDAWAQHPGESLDPVTFALVDPDQSVRARAQELLEQELARR